MTESNGVDVGETHNGVFDRSSSAGIGPPWDNCDRRDRHDMVKSLPCAWSFPTETSSMSGVQYIGCALLQISNIFGEVGNERLCEGIAER
jgi:hypothetical protein